MARLQTPTGGGYRATGVRLRVPVCAKILHSGSTKRYAKSLRLGKSCIVPAFTQSSHLTFHSSCPQPPHVQCVLMELLVFSLYTPVEEVAT